ncbi:Hypothetical predicted protein [Marmota monax]|uniref:EGF-like domain-containing protein n=1 Tax=Marmota monax TaxID=9995 RepID=A0A5E4D6T2_MARMO|nr:Hypothetical predicted protein [Marmota monax]
MGMSPSTPHSRDLAALVEACVSTQVATPPEPRGGSTRPPSTDLTCDYPTGGSPRPGPAPPLAPDWLPVLLLASGSPLAPKTLTACPCRPADVNECEAGRCSQECANIYGSYQCYCRQGYQLAEDGHTCTGGTPSPVGRPHPVGLPHLAPLPRAALARAPGSQSTAPGLGAQGLQRPRLLGTCSGALADFLLLLSAAGTWGGLGSPGPNFSLADIDECAQGAGILCTFRCLNVPGSYQCACPDQGYTMMANGRTCKGEQWPCPTGLRGSRQHREA